MAHPLNDKRTSSFKQYQQSFNSISLSVAQTEHEPIYKLQADTLF